MLLALVAVVSITGEAEPMLELQPFELTQVRLLDGPIARAMEANRAYLHSLDTDSLLYAFRQNAGLDTPGTPLGGWEAPTCEVRGHFVGHYLSACAMVYQSMGDEALKAKADNLVAEMAKCQQALDGFLSAFPTSFLDRMEAHERTWALLYVLHKTMQGMLDMYTRCGNEQALRVVSDAADFLSRRFAPLSLEEMNTILDEVEEGGICDVLWELYMVTGKPEHRALAEKLEKRSFIGAMARSRDVLAGRHGNTHIPLAVGAARRYEITGETRYRHAVQFFWDRVVVPRSYASGGSTDEEAWGPAYELAEKRAQRNHETCKTYNMLKVTRHLLCWTGEGRYGDFYERAFFNGILGTQEVNSGMLAYYLPMANGYQRIFGTPTDAFWCCYGSGVENWAKPGDSIYFHNDDTLSVNLYIPSELTWSGKRLRVTQETRFPEEENSTLTFHVDGAPVRLNLSVRIPYWAKRGAVVRVNGQAVDQKAVPGGILGIERAWKDGDQVSITLPMDLHLWPMPDDPNLVAVMYGPLVLAGLCDPEGPAAPLFSNDPALPQPEAEDRWRPVCFNADSLGDLSWLERVPGDDIRFRTVGQKVDMEFIPINQVVGERFGIYWPVLPAGSDRETEVLSKKIRVDLLEDLEEQGRIIDRVLVGIGESEQGHNLQGEGTVSAPYGRQRWRHATEWWSWDLAVRPGAPMDLVCAYWGSDVGRTFDILVDGQVIAREELHGERPNEYFLRHYALPEARAAGKETVAVRFEKVADFAGGVFACAIVTR